MIQPNHILSRLSEGEVIVATERKAWFESCITKLLSNSRAEELSMEDAGGDDDFWPKPDDWRAAYRPYVVKDGVLQIPIFGVLLNRFEYQVGRYATGYTYILRALQRGLADGNVKGIALLCDTPGGEVAGNFELVDKIFAARSVKPIRAFAAEHAYSAGYSIASAAHKISMTRTAGVGSIGVVTMHVDYSEAMDKAGIKVTFIYAGKMKVEGNPYEKLSATAKGRIQKRIDRVYGIFVATVARNRGIDEQVVRDTEAGTFGAEEALELGLADEEAVFEESVEAFSKEVSAEDGNGDDDMATFTQEQHDAATAQARKEGETAGNAAGMTAAKTRFLAILGCDNAKDRPQAALAAALDTDMSAEQANTFLGKLASEVQAKADDKGDKKKKADDEDEEEGDADKKKKSAKTKDSARGSDAFSQHMNSDQHPEAGGGEDDEDKAQGNPLLAAFSMATGIKTGVAKQ